MGNLPQRRGYSGRLFPQRLCFRAFAPICEPKDIHLRHYVHRGIYSAAFQREYTGFGCLCHTAGIYGLCFHALLVGVRLVVPQAVFHTCQSSQYHYGTSAGLLCGIIVFITPIFLFCVPPLPQIRRGTLFCLQMP